MADGVFGQSCQLSLNKFFDSSTPSMRKVDDGGKEKKGKKENAVYSGHQRRCRWAARTPTNWNTARSCQK